jgi:putative transposase
MLLIPRVQTRTDIKPRYKKSPPCFAGRAHFVDGARDQIRVGLPFEVYDLSYSSLADRSRLPLPLSDTRSIASASTLDMNTSLSVIIDRWVSTYPGKFIQPETVVRWHRKGFALYWRSISKPGPGRPPIPQELQALIRQLASENDWRTGKIQAELEKLGFTISLATVSRTLPKRRPDLDRRQCRTTFLRNHRDAIAAMDFLVVPTVRFKLLYVWFVIEHGRRRILHVNVTANPTSSWTIQQLREAFPDEHSLRFLIHDNDTIFPDRVAEAIGNLEIDSKRTTYRSPWQNGIAERWVGTVRRELLDHVIVLNEQHLQRLLPEYVEYYNTDRVHTQLQDSPRGRSAEHRPSPEAQIVGKPRVGGLHRRYEWQEAA